MDWEQAIATGHIVAAVSALLAGAAVLLRPKGTRTHRRIGTVYVLALVLVNVAALSLHRENAFGVFHALAVASLVTIAVGLSPLLLGKRSETVIATHAYCMTWSYRWFGSGRMRTTSRRRWSRPFGVGCAGGDRHGVDRQWRHHLRESAVNL